MFTNTFGIRLVLLLGDTVPLPAPYEVSSAFQRAEVTNDSGSGQGDGFQLTFALGRDASDYRLVQKNGPLATMKRVVIGVVFGVAPEVLIDGIITHHQFNPGTQPGQATLTVTGRDLTILLDLEEKNESYPNLADFVIVNKVLANYARYGVIPTAEKTTDFPVQIDRIPRQQETDLAFVRRLAEPNGFVFYLEPITFGVSSAYWGPEQSKETPQPALSLNQGGATNLRSFDVNEDALGPVNSEGAVLNPDTKSGIAVSAVPS